jgi:tetraacyldisaccharide 4'-kinase
VGAREPYWWYAGLPEPWVARALAPLGAVYGSFTARRMRRQSQYGAKIPVICVGNFTAGGTGKTPFVRTILALLRQVGHTPAVLSRGYGGTVAGPHWVDLALDTASQVGDEPLLLASDAPVLVARDRAAGAKAIEKGNFSVIVMDDGLQNPALAKDFSFSVVDAARGFGTGRCIPAGPLRAPLALQVPMVQAVILNVGAGGRGTSTAFSEMLDRQGVPVFAGRITTVGPLEWLRTQPVVAYAGIGVPERFFQTLREAGADLADAIIFPDHHIFTEADAQRLLARVAGKPLLLVTTEKDATRLRGTQGARAALAKGSRALPVALEFGVGDTAALIKLIAEAIPLRA